MMRAAVNAIVRVLSGLALTLISLYYLLASIPFSYHQFLQFPHFWWLLPFIRVHPFVLAAAVAALTATTGGIAALLRPWRRRFAIAGATIAVCMAAVEWQPALFSYDLAFALFFAPLALVAAAGALVAAAELRGADGAARQRSRWPLVGSFVAAGAIVAAAYLVEGIGRGAADTLRSGEIAVAGAVSAASHIAGFGIAGLLAVALAGFAARRQWPVWVRWAAVAGWAVIVLATIIRRSLLTALILSEGRAIGVALAFAVAIILFAAALLAGRPPAVDSASRRLWRGVLSAVALVALVDLVPRMLVLADWGLSVQKLIVLASWGCAFVLVRTLPSVGRVGAAAVAMLTAAILVAVPSAHTRAAAWGTGHGEPLDVPLAIDRYETFDTSFTIWSDVARPLVADSAFYDLLRQAGDITDDTTLAARTLPIADLSAPLPSTPNIFFIVVDSLRPDYLSPYNAAVSFTPRIGAFAKESILFHRAFTPYAGTALSEPAMWVGGLLQRAIYVQPFSALNNLEALARRGGYRRYVSIDEVLDVLLKDRDGMVHLDAALARLDSSNSMFKLDLCTTLGELAGRLDRDRTAQPVLFYAQPKNLHVRMIIGDEQYPQFVPLRAGEAEFFAPAAHVVERIDGCFGRFVDHLKASGLWDNSIVVLTSDHGDAYGEAGRWGHAFYLAPETLRVPLMLHVPQKYLAGRSWDPDRLAMTTDITPTLFDLSGRPPAEASGLVGRSLLPRSGTAVPPPAEMFLVQSSYSRVFGVLDGQARWLYTADVNHAREQFYDLSSSSPYPVRLPLADRPMLRQRLLARLNALGRFYRPGSGALTTVVDRPRQ